MLRNGRSFAGQQVVFWERKNGDQCFGEEKELDDREEIQQIGSLLRRMEDSCAKEQICVSCVNGTLKVQDYGI